MTCSTRLLTITLLASAAAALLVAGAACNGNQGPGGKVIEPAAPSGLDVAFAAFQSASSVPAARVPLVAEAPVVDGQLDAAYAKAEPLNFRFLNGADGKPKAATTVRVVSTADALFVFATCETPAVGDIVADVRDHDGSVWRDDCVELFIDPSNKRSLDDYMHIQVNSIGVTADAKGPKANQDASWEPALSVKTKALDNAWVMEMSIPFKELCGPEGRVNRVWAANFNRMAYLLTGDEDTAWSPTGVTDSHVPARFGALWLDAGNVENYAK